MKDVGLFATTAQGVHGRRGGQQEFYLVPPAASAASLSSGASPRPPPLRAAGIGDPRLASSGRSSSVGSGKRLLEHIVEVRRTSVSMGPFELFLLRLGRRAPGQLICAQCGGRRSGGSSPARTAVILNRLDRGLRRAMARQAGSGSEGRRSSAQSRTRTWKRLGPSRGRQASRVGSARRPRRRGKGERRFALAHDQPRGALYFSAIEPIWPRCGAFDLTVLTSGGRVLDHDPRVVFFRAPVVATDVRGTGAHRRASGTSCRTGREAFVRGRLLETRAPRAGGKRRERVLAARTSGVAEAYRKIYAGR
jgi:hypothetical protein